MILSPHNNSSQLNSAHEKECPPLEHVHDGTVSQRAAKSNGTESLERKVNDDVDIDVGTAIGPPPRLPNGDTYVVGFVRASEGVFCGKARLFLWFQIVEPTEYAGQQIYLCCPKPEKGRFGIGSKFVEAWRVAAGQWPARRDRLSTKVFRGSYFRAAVRTVTRNQHGDERPENDHYSKIDRLIERVAGGINK